MDETIKVDFRRRKSPLDHTGVEYDYLLFIVFLFKVPDKLQTECGEGISACFISTVCVQYI